MKDDFLKNKSILITGGTGSFGRNFTEKLVLNHKPSKIIIFSRDEFKQYQMQNFFNQKKYLSKQKNKNLIRYFIGDVRDKERLKLALYDDVDIVIHAAALKQVPTCEYNPFEAVKTNILGAQNLIDACMSSHVQKVIALSTDKASSPANLYGATKLTSDKLFIAANNYKGKKDIKFSVVRYGNVMGSRGSIIPMLNSKINESKIPITDLKMTRFNITLDESINFVFNCLKSMWGGELFVPKLPSYKLLDLCKAICPESKYEIIGVRPGEKLHEEMISKADSFSTVEFKKYFVIMPNLPIFHWNKKQFMKTSNTYPGKLVKEDFIYNSLLNKNYLSVNDIIKLIKLNQHTFYSN
jgi:UDP-N-acetylglucosamine 4,6-dehydratase (inverting)